jgi:hypothetical protein
MWCVLPAPCAPGQVGRMSRSIASAGCPPPPSCAARTRRAPPPRSPWPPAPPASGPLVAQGQRHARKPRTAISAGPRPPRARAGPPAPRARAPPRPAPRRRAVLPEPLLAPDGPKGRQPLAQAARLPGGTANCVSPASPRPRVPRPRATEGERGPGRARRAQPVAIIQVVHVGRVEVHRHLDAPQPQRLAVEGVVRARIAREHGDVVQPLTLSGMASSCIRLTPR